MRWGGETEREIEGVSVRELFGSPRELLGASEDPSGSLAVSVVASWAVKAIAVVTVLAVATRSWVAALGALGVFGAYVGVLYDGLYRRVGERLNLRTGTDFAVRTLGFVGGAALVPVALAALGAVVPVGPLAAFGALLPGATPLVGTLLQGGAVPVLGLALVGVGVLVVAEGAGMLRRRVRIARATPYVGDEPADGLATFVGTVRTIDPGGDRPADVAEDAADAGESDGDVAEPGEAVPGRGVVEAAGGETDADFVAGTAGEKPGVADGTRNGGSEAPDPVEAVDPDGDDAEGSGRRVRVRAGATGSEVAAPPGTTVEDDPGSGESTDYDAPADRADSPGPPADRTGSPDAADPVDRQGPGGNAPGDDPFEGTAFESMTPAGSDGTTPSSDGNEDRKSGSIEDEVFATLGDAGADGEGGPSPAASVDTSDSDSDEGDEAAVIDPEEATLDDPAGFDEGNLAVRNEPPARSDRTEPPDDLRTDGGTTSGGTTDDDATVGRSRTTDGAGIPEDIPAPGPGAVTLRDGYGDDDPVAVDGDTGGVVVTGGGTDPDTWRRRVVDWLADAFEDERGVDLREDPEARERLEEVADRARLDLADREETEVLLPFIAEVEGAEVHLIRTLSAAPDAAGRVCPPFGDDRGDDDASTTAETDGNGRQGTVRAPHTGEEAVAYVHRRHGRHVREVDLGGRGSLVLSARALDAEVGGVPFVVESFHTPVRVDPREATLELNDPVVDRDARGVTREATVAPGETVTVVGEVDERDGEEGYVLDDDALVSTWRPAEVRKRLTRGGLARLAAGSVAALVGATLLPAVGTAAAAGAAGVGLLVVRDPIDARERMSVPVPGALEVARGLDRKLDLKPRAERMARCLAVAASYARSAVRTVRPGE